MLIAIFVLGTAAKGADAPDSKLLNAKEAAELLQRWSAVSRYAVLTVSGTYQHSYIDKNGKITLDENTTFGLAQEIVPPCRKKLSLSPEQNLESDDKSIVSYRDVYYDPSRVIEVTSRNGLTGQLKQVNMVRIYKPDSADSARNILTLSLQALLPDFVPTQMGSFDTMTANDLRKVKLGADGGMTVIFDNGRLPPEPGFWKTMSPDGARVLRYSGEGESTKLLGPQWGVYGETSKEVLPGNLNFPRSVRIWVRIGDDWTLNSYEFNRCEGAATESRDEFQPRFEPGYSIYDTRTGVGFIVGDSPEKMIQEIEKTLRSSQKQ